MKHFVKNIEIPENSTEGKGSRNMTDSHRKRVDEKLIQYQKSLLASVISTTAHGDIHTLTYLQLLLGFTDHQTMQVLDNLHIIFTIGHVYKTVEMWDH